ncbi:MAG: TetR/AcrR family transcriptional regulator [Actinomycetes bacterium]|jgi:AcrR family transcriptional regulator|nr:TetR/AcrR family transcriptional regulator [Acidimicrobiia bacterium]
MRYRVGLETRTRILEATRDLVAAQGLEKTTIKAICEKAGILVGSFYNLFESKEEAILTVVADAIRAVGPEDEEATLHELVDAYVDFVEKSETTARVYLMVAVSGGLTDEGIRARMLRHHERRIELFGRALRTARPDMPEEEVRQRVEGLLAALNGMAFHRLLDPSFDFRSYARALLQIGA